MSPQAQQRQRTEGAVILDVEDVQKEVSALRSNKQKLSEIDIAVLDMADLLEKEGASDSAGTLRRGVLPPRTIGERATLLYNHEITVGDLLWTALGLLGAYTIYSGIAYYWDLPGGFFGKKGSTENLMESAGAKRRVAA